MAEGDEMAFPGVGNRYDVRFSQFHVQLYFTSETSMTYWNVDSNGGLTPGETVTTDIVDVGDGKYLVRWQEQDESVVVHLEDYSAMRIYTNIASWNDDHTKIVFFRDAGDFSKI
ncbi:MAG: hypothetical protein P4M09_00200 [Devosia sp.]|nr:hypothetical protein [Devosia sp.]